MTVWNDDRISAVLSEVGQELDCGQDSLDIVALLNIDERRSPRQGLRLVAAAVVLLLAAGALMVVTPTREAIADWLGIGRTRIELPNPGAGSTQAPEQRLDTEASRVGPGAAERLLGRALPEIPTLEPIDFRTPPEGGVLIVYADALTLWVQVQDEGGPVLQKTVGSGGSVTWLDDLGDGGALVSGPHTLTTPGRELGSDSVVLWTERGLEVRLEGDLSDAQLIELAHSVEFG